MKNERVTSLREAILGPFREAGWKKRGGSVYVINDVGAMVALSSSPYGLHSYVDVGFWFPGTTERHPPPLHKCPIQERLESVFPSGHDMIVAATSVAMPTPEQLTRLRGFIRADVLPLMTSMRTKVTLRDAMLCGRIGSQMVTLEAQAELDIQGESGHWVIASADGSS